MSSHEIFLAKTKLLNSLMICPAETLCMLEKSHFVLLHIRTGVFWHKGDFIILQRIRIELVVPFLWLLCFLLFSICLLHSREEDSAVAIRLLKLRDLLVKFSCVLHILLYWYPLWKVASWYHYTKWSSSAFTSYSFALET